MKKRLFGLIALIFPSLISFAQRPFYISFDDTCMEKMEYQDAKDPKIKQTYFHLYLNDSEKVIFETKSPINRSSLPREAQTCSRNDLGEETVYSVNENRAKGFILVKNPRSGYTRYEIAQAAYLITADDFVEYKTRGLSFAYDFQPRDRSSDIANPESAYHVYYVRRSYDCPVQIRFRAKKKEQKSAFNRSRSNSSRSRSNTSSSSRTTYDLEFTLVPGIGLTEVVQPPQPPLNTNRTLKLVNVNGKKAKEYMDYCCKYDCTKARRNMSISEGGSSTRPGTSTGGTNNRDEHVIDRVYMDLNRGLYIDVYNEQPANLEWGGFRYINGQRYTLDVSANTPFTGQPVSNPNVATGACSVVYSYDAKQWIELSTQRPADGVCNQVLYRNGQKIGPVGNQQPGVGNSSCQVFLGANNIYMDAATGLPATTECNGYVYTNGIITGRSSGGNTVPNRPGGGTAGGNQNRNGDCLVASRPGVHVVQKNETLYSVSRRYGLSVAQLKAWNNMPDDYVFPCMELRTRNTNVTNDFAVASYDQTRPTSYGESGPDLYPRGRQGYHTVREGETLSQIAGIYACTTDRLREMNELGRWEKVIAGQELKVSGCNEPRDAVNVPTGYDDTSGQRLIFSNNNSKGEPEKPTLDIYEVKKGDTLSKIANKFKTTVSRLRELNGIKGDMIYAGQQMYVD